MDISQDLPQIYYETSDEAYKEVVDTEDDIELGIAVTDSTQSDIIEVGGSRILIVHCQIWTLKCSLVHPVRPW